MKKNIAYLELLDWGVSIGGEHFYASVLIGDEKVKLEHTLTKEEAEYLNKKDSCQSYSLYSEGDKTERFPNEEEAIKAAIKYCEGKVKLILKGSRSFASVQPAVYGEDSVVKVINELASMAEKIGYYSGKNDELMEQIDKTFDSVLEHVSKLKG